MSSHGANIIIFVMLEDLWATPSRNWKKVKFAEI
jgi:hypothetical protein